MITPLPRSSLQSIESSSSKPFHVISSKLEKKNKKKKQKKKKK